MRTVLTSIFCIITLSYAGPISAQAPPVLTDEMMRRLGGDPDKARADAAKRALEARSPEDIANDERAIAMSGALTDDSISRIPSSDPLLLSLYRNRIGTGSGVSNEFPWLLVVDRDIRRRPEAQALFQTQFRKTNQYGNRCYVMNWLAGNADVPWGNNLMEEAIKFYRADPSKWEYADVHALCRLIQVRGNESHLEFLDEINAVIGDGGAGRALRRRLQATKEKNGQEPNSVTLPNAGEKTKVKSVVQAKPSSPQEYPKSRQWMIIVALMAAALALLWLVLKGRK